MARWSPRGDIAPDGVVLIMSSRMPTIHEILQRRAVERRSLGRTFIGRNAMMFFAGQAGVYSCHVRDVTNHGAGIRLDGLNVIPVKFDLSFDNFHTIRRCQLVWRNDDFLGVTFDN
jgi:hypothetical protein